MGDKSGETKKEQDFWGNEKEVHYDSDGNKIGETKFTTDWLGNAKQEHYDIDGNKTGETHKGSDWLGRDRAEHFDIDGNKIGHSKDDTNFWGQSIQKHYDSDGNQVGETSREEGWFGDRKKVHSGTYFKGSSNDHSELDNTSSHHSSGRNSKVAASSGGSSCLVSVIVVIVVGVILGWIAFSNSNNSQNLSASYAQPTQEIKATTKETANPQYYQRHYLDEVKTIDNHIQSSLSLFVKEELDLTLRWVSHFLRRGWGDFYFDVEDYEQIGNSLWITGARFGYGRIIHSNDNGNSWDIQYLGKCYPFVVYFTSQSVGWIGSKDGLFLTQDGGISWEFVDIGGEGSYVDEYCFFFDGKISASYAYGGKYTSEDGGRTWH